MRYFLDTEFNEEADPAEIISIGAVSEDGREFYAINQGYAFSDSPKWASCNAWVCKNVEPIVTPEGVTVNLLGDEKILRDGLQAFVGLDPHPEFWAYFGAYDWYLLCRLFKSFDRMPKSWAHICYDVKQYQKHVGLLHLPAKFTPEHNALIDARWTKFAWERVKAEQDLLNKSLGKKGIVWP